MNKKVFSFILAVVVLSLLDSVVAFAIENDGAFDSYSISIQTSTSMSFH